MAFLTLTERIVELEADNFELRKQITAINERVREMSAMHRSLSEQVMVLPPARARAMRSPSRSRSAAGRCA